MEGTLEVCQQRGGLQERLTSRGREGHHTQLSLSLEERTEREDDGVDVKPVG